MPPVRSRYPGSAARLALPPVVNLQQIGKRAAGLLMRLLMGEVFNPSGLYGLGENLRYMVKRGGPIGGDLRHREASE